MEGTSIKVLAQSRHRAFSPVVGIGTPHPFNRRRVCPPPPAFWFRGAHSLAGEGVAESNSDEGTHTGTLYRFRYVLVGTWLPHICWHPYWCHSGRCLPGTLYRLIDESADGYGRVPERVEIYVQSNVCSWVCTFVRLCLYAWLCASWRLYKFVRLCFACMLCASGVYTFLTLYLYARLHVLFLGACTLERLCLYCTKAQTWLCLGGSINS